MALVAEIKGSKLILTLDINNPPVPSKSGKSLTVATTNGNHATTAQVGGKVLVVGVNAYTAR